MIVMPTDRGSVGLSVFEGDACHSLNDCCRVLRGRAQQFPTRPAAEAHPRSETPQKCLWRHSAWPQSNGAPPTRRWSGAEPRPDNRDATAGLRCAAWPGRHPTPNAPPVGAGAPPAAPADGGGGGEAGHARVTAGHRGRRRRQWCDRRSGGTPRRGASRGAGRKPAPAEADKEGVACVCARRCRTMRPAVPHHAPGVVAPGGRRGRITRHRRPCLGGGRGTPRRQRPWGRPRRWGGRERGAPRRPPAAVPARTRWWHPRRPPGTRRPPPAAGGPVAWPQAPPAPAPACRFRLGWGRPPAAARPGRAAPRRGRRGRGSVLQPRRCRAAMGLALGGAGPASTGPREPPMTRAPSGPPPLPPRGSQDASRSRGLGRSRATPRSPSPPSSVPSRQKRRRHAAVRRSGRRRQRRWRRRRRVHDGRWHAAGHRHGRRRRRGAVPRPPP